jgi:hypothetical protein
MLVQKKWASFENMEKVGMRELFPKFFHIILLLIYFQVWYKEVVVFFLYVSIASIFELLCI